MRPQPAEIMSGTAAWTRPNVPVRLTARIRDREGGGPFGVNVLGRRLGRRSVAIEDGDAVAVGGEPAGDAEPDAGRAPGDDGDAAHRFSSAGANSRCSSVRPRWIQVGS
jgi:hypothetical protein